MFLQLISLKGFSSIIYFHLRVPNVCFVAPLMKFFGLLRLESKESHKIKCQSSQYVRNLLIN